jgi:hypothetical protein
LFYLSLYCFGLAAMIALYFLLYAAPHVVPGIAERLSPSNQQWIESTGIRWVPPFALISIALLAGIGLWFGDRRDSFRSTPRGDKPQDT